VPDPTEVVRGGFAQRDGVGNVTMNPGPKSTRHLYQMAANRVRLRICRIWMSLEITNPVDIELDCDAATTTRIREHINWCRQQPAHTAGTIPPA